MISGKELFSEISNEAVTEDGEVVGYFVKNSRMNLLEQMLFSTVTVKLPEPFKMAKSSSGLTYYYADEVNAALTAAGIKWEGE